MDAGTFQRLLDAVSDGVIVLDGSARVVFVNEVAAGVLGLREGQALEEASLDLVRDEGAAMALTEFAPMQTLLGQGDVHGQMVGVRSAREKTLRWLQVDSQLLRDNGHVQCVVTLHELTEQRRILLECAQAEAELRALMAAMTDVILTLNAEGRYIKVAPTNPSLLYRPASELVGRTLHEVFAKPMADRFLENVHAALSQKRTVEMEYVLSIRDREMWFSARLSPLGADTVVFIARDITARKQAEADLARLAAGVEQSYEAMIITDTDWVIRYVNPAFERVTGYSREEALGQRPRDLLDSERNDERIYGDIDEALGKGQTWRGHFVNRRKDGSFYEEDATISPIRDPNGKIVSYVTVKRDVTHQVMLESQLRQAQKMEAVGRMAGGIAHDFNNILVAILGYAELVMGALPAESPLREDVVEIVQAAERAANLTRQLLAFSRRQACEPQMLSLNEALLSLENMFKRLLGESITLETRTSAEPALVKVDPSNLEQVLLNLVVNARDAMPNGGTLTLETEVVELDEAYAASHVGVEPGSYVLLAVSDTGCGMDAELQSHIFEPFFTTKAMGQGTGLGLSIVYGIVRQSGGSIWVTSEPGAGTTFRIYLPKVLAPTEKSSSPAPASKPTSAVTVLVVEDERVIRALARRALEQHGYEVLEASDTQQALAQASLRGGRIDLLLTDVVMPQASGVEIARELKQLCPNMKVLYMSGYTQNVVGLREDRAEGIGFLQKPFRNETLVAKVRQLLGLPVGMNGDDSEPRH